MTVVVTCVPLKIHEVKKGERNKGQSIHEMPTGMTGPVLPQARKLSAKKIPQGQIKVK